MSTLTQREILLLSASSLVAFTCYASIVYSSHLPGPYVLPFFLLLSLIISLLSIFIFCHFQRYSRQIPFMWIFLTAIAFRLIAVTAIPMFEDDYYRYLWDGYQMATQGDPYTLAPAYFFDADIPELFEEILSGINYPDVATVYGPLCQWVFALSYKLAPGMVWPLQVIAALADIGVLCVLRLMTRHNALLLYAWSPLLIKEFAITAHPDIIAILFSIIAVWAWRKDRPLLTGVVLALAVSTKVFAVLLLPFLLFGNNGFRTVFSVIGSFVIVLALVTLSFGTVGIWLPEGLLAMADSWLFNAPLYALLVDRLPFSVIKAGLLIAFLLIVSIAFFRTGRDFWHSRVASEHLRGDWLFGGFLLCLPVVNSWYVPWLLPFAVLYPSRWAWFASVTVLLSYWTVGNLGALAGNSAVLLHDVSGTVLVIEYGLVALAIVADTRSAARKGGAAGSTLY